MKVVNVHAAKTNFSKLLISLEKTRQPIVICRNGKPIADLVPHKKQDRTIPHPELSKIVIRYDSTEDLTEEEWPKEFR